MSLLTNLVAYYKFDGDATDATGNGNNGTPVGNASFIAGKLGSAASIAGAVGGVANRINLPGPLALGTSWSVSFWINGVAGQPFPIGTVLGQTIQRGLTTSGGSITFYSGGNAATCIAGFTIGVWEHYVATYDGTSVRWYKSGALVNTDVVALAAWTPAYILNGSDGWSPTYSTIDEMAIYSRVLDAAEIAQLYGGGAGLAYPLSTASELLPPVIASGATLFPPVLVALPPASALTPPVIASGALLFAPSLANPAPIVTPPVVDPAVPEVIPLVRALQLPLPTSMTRVKGIHQSDIIIRSALTAALADMRANPWLLDYVFASLPQDALTWKEYGEKDLQQAKKWFLTTHVPVSVLPRMDESKFPQITIELQESSEVTPESIMGDINYEPSEDNDTTWPALTPPFTPSSYTPATGVVRLSIEPEALVAKGMFLVDRRGVAHEIIDVSSQVRFKVAPGTVADFRGCILKGHRPNWKVDIESSSFKESYRIGIHISGEPAHLTWLHAIVQFALLRYKQVLMEARGFERSTISSSQVARAEWSEAENVFSRFITVSGFVRQFWPKTVAPAIDGVQFEGLQVSGQNGAGVQMKGSGADPEDSLWIGNLDSLRTRR